MYRRMASSAMAQNWRPQYSLLRCLNSINSLREAFPLMYDMILLPNKLGEPKPKQAHDPCPRAPVECRSHWCDTFLEPNRATVPKRAPATRLSDTLSSTQKWNVMP